MRDPLRLDPQLRRLADAVMREGYVLYPYRASAAKNRYRWTFGVLAPRSWSERGGSEPWWLEAQCLIAGSNFALRGWLRFHRIQQRTVERTEAGSFVPVSALEADEQLFLPFEEARVEEVAFEESCTVALTDGACTEEIIGSQGAIGRVVRKSDAILGAIHVRTERLQHEPALSRLTVRVENLTPCREPRVSREAVLPASMISTHLVLSLYGACFVSVIDPPSFAAAAARETWSVRAYPVLAGDPQRCDSVLAAPIILYDHPRLAPESTGDFFDSTEIDELLALRTLALTDREKREIRATDPLAAELLARVEAITPEGFARLHGAERAVLGGEMVPKELRPEEMGFRPGDRVRLAPGIRRTDAQDLLYAGLTATVEAVRADVDGSIFLGVVVDDDPGADLRRLERRYHYYRTDEVERLDGEST